MMDVPAKILERRAELGNLAEYHRRAIEDHRHWVAVEEAELAGLDLCIAAIEDAAKTPNAEAGEGETPSGEVTGAPGAEIAPAGSVDPKKPRAPKRDIRGMVLVELAAEGPCTPEVLARALDVPRRAVDSAVEYWQAKGRLTLADGVVMLRTAGAERDYQIAARAERSEPARKESLHTEPPPLTHADPVEILSPEPVYVDEGGRVSPFLAREDLVGFLERNPDSNMAEINDAGIPAAEVYRAERAGVVVAKPHGLYALPEAEAQQSEAAE